MESHTLSFAEGYQGRQLRFLQHISFTQCTLFKLFFSPARCDRQTLKKFYVRVYRVKKQ